MWRVQQSCERLQLVGMFERQPCKRGRQWISGLERARARETTTLRKATRVFQNFEPKPQLANSHMKPEGSGWIDLEQVAGQTRARQMQGGGSVCRCAQVRNQSRRDRGRLPQRHRRRSASNATRPTHQHVDTQKHKQPRGCQPAATRTEAPRRRRATPSRRRLHVIGRASSRGLHKLRGRPPRRRSRRSRQPAK